MFFQSYFSGQMWAGISSFSTQQMIIIPHHSSYISPQTARGLEIFTTLPACAYLSETSSANLFSFAKIH